MECKLHNNDTQWQHLYIINTILQANGNVNRSKWISISLFCMHQLNEVEEKPKNKKKDCKTCILRKSFVNQVMRIQLWNQFHLLNIVVAVCCKFHIFSICVFFFFCLRNRISFHLTSFDMVDICYVHHRVRGMKFMLKGILSSLIETSLKLLIEILLRRKSNWKVNQRNDAMPLIPFR